MQRFVILNSYLRRLVIDNKFPGITGSLPVCPLGEGKGIMTLIRSMIYKQTTKIYSVDVSK